MLNKKLKATSPGVRHQVLITKNILCKNTKFIKKNLITLKNKAGHSKQDGHITSWHRGGGNKKKYFLIKPLTNKNFFICVAIIYNNSKNCFIAVLFSFQDLTFNFVIHSENHVIGSLIEFNLNNKTISQKTGSIIKLSNIHTGAIINSIFNKNRIIYSRSAGTYCQIVQKLKTNIKLKLPSGKILNTNDNFFATIGCISNKNKVICVVGKAGKNRCKGRRPIVRGVAMNPVDHPHGGRTNGGRPSVSPWGILTKGVKTKKK